MKKIATACDTIGRLHGFTPRVVICVDAFGLHSIKMEWERWNHTWAVFHEMFPHEDMTLRETLNRFAEECLAGLEGEDENGEA